MTVSGLWTLAAPAAEQVKLSFLLVAQRVQAVPRVSTVNCKMLAPTAASTQTALSTAVTEALLCRQESVT